MMSRTWLTACVVGLLFIAGCGEKAAPPAEKAAVEQEIKQLQDLRQKETGS
jgi:predicted small lipoprotein YifL